MTAIPINRSSHECLYTADVFPHTSTEHRQENQGQKNKTSHTQQTSITIQRQAAIMITGAMKMTATDITEVMANLMPLPLLVDKHLTQSMAI
jgi:hypothetical protein